MSHGTKTSSAGGRTTIKWVLLLIAFVLGLGYCKGQYNEAKKEAKVDAKMMADVSMCKNDEGKWVKIPAGHYRGEDCECTEGTPPPARISSYTARSAKQLYRFPASGCITVTVRLGKANFYPKGGEIRITPPKDSGAVAWNDKPGTENSNPNKSLPDGEYTICKVGKDAWGVDVWN